MCRHGMHARTCSRCMVSSSLSSASQVLCQIRQTARMSGLLPLEPSSSTRWARSRLGPLCAMYEVLELPSRAASFAASLGRMTNCAHALDCDC